MRGYDPSLRRAYPTETMAHLEVGDITLDESERSVTVGSVLADLTGAEFHLLRLLLEKSWEGTDPRRTRTPKSLAGMPLALIAASTT